MQISDAGLELIKRWEGLRLQSYRDAVGVWTIGYGHTHTAGPGQWISPEKAEDLLRRDVAWAERAVRDFVRVPLAQNQFDALVSFVFNVGTGAFQRSTLLRLLNRGRYGAVRAQLMRWINAGGRPLRGLVRRREAEADMFEGVEHGDA